MNSRSRNIGIIGIVFFLLIIRGNAAPSSSIDGLSENIRIESQSLGYDLQYRIYYPPGHEEQSGLPTLYITDGQQYIKKGNLPKVISSLIKKKKIKPVVAVFIDPRDPDNLSINRRNEQFFCNPSYVKFVTRELIPTIESHHHTSEKVEDRVIMGHSFGGLNAACFGVMTPDVFGGIAMLSPAMHPVPRIVEAYKKLDKLPLKIYLSTGTYGDNFEKTRAFKSALKKKGYELRYKVRVDAAHNWNNWKPLMGDVLLYYFSVKQSHTESFH